MPIQFNVDYLSDDKTLGVAKSAENLEYNRGWLVMNEIKPDSQFFSVGKYVCIQTTKQMVFVDFKMRPDLVSNMINAPHNTQDLKQRLTTALEGYNSVYEKQSTVSELVLVPFENVDLEDDL